MKNKETYILFMLFFIISCSPEETIDITTTERVKMMLNKINRNGSLSNTYEYDDENRLVSNTYQAGVASYSYSQDTTYGQLTSYNGDIINSSKRYSINENSIRHDFFDSQGYLDYYRIYDYNIDMCGYSRQKNYNEQGELFSYSTVEYFKPNCSSIELFMNSEDELVKKVTIRKNDVFSATNSIRLQPKMFEVEYQWISRQAEDGEGNINPQGTYEQTINTNNFNYSINMISTTTSGAVTDFEYIYF